MDTNVYSSNQQHSSRITLVQSQVSKSGPSIGIGLTQENVSAVIDDENIVTDTMIFSSERMQQSKLHSDRKGTSGLYLSLPWIGEGLLH